MSLWAQGGGDWCIQLIFGSFRVHIPAFTESPLSFNVNPAFAFIFMTDYAVNRIYTCQS